MGGGGGREGNDARALPSRKEEKGKEKSAALKKGGKGIILSFISRRQKEKACC